MPEFPGIPEQPFGVSQDIQGTFIIRGLGEKAKIVPDSALANYLRAMKSLSSKDPADGLGDMEASLHRPLDFSAVVPDAESDCPESAREVASGIVLSHIRRSVYGLCRESGKFGKKHSMDSMRLLKVCLATAFWIAGAEPPSFNAISVAEGILQECERRIEMEFRAKGEVAKAEEIAKARQSVQEHFCKRTGPLMDACLKQSIMVWEVAKKIGIQKSDECRLAKSLEDTERMLARYLANGWLRVARPDAVREWIQEGSSDLPK